MLLKFLFVTFATLIVAFPQNELIGEEFIPIVDANAVDPSNIACVISIHNQTGTPQPVFIRPGTEKFFHPANRDGQIQMTANEPMELWCSSSWPNFPGAPNLITATCVSGTTFNYNGANFDFNQFRCQSWPQWTTRRRTSPRCFNNGIYVDVGFEIDSRWLHVLTSCHDLVLETNWYTFTQFTPISAANQRSVSRPSFNQAGFFPGKTVNTLYTRNMQRSTIATILNCQSCADIFIEADPSDVFMSRGHLTAMTDVILATEQQATFLYINTAPQFQTFNGQNWVAVEISSRNLASDRNLYLDVYTGTYGIGQFWNETGSRAQTFLDWPAGQIPVPQLYYKILVNHADNSGVVFLGVNNPHLTLDEIYMHGYIICNDVSDRIDYVSWQRENLRRGYSYACEVNDFLNHVPHIQGLNVARLLV